MSEFGLDPNPLQKPDTYWQRLSQYAWIIAGLWIIEISDRVLLGGSLEQHGIHPRDLSHWDGFLFAPFLHGSWGHLIGNSISLLILGAAILIKGWRDLVIVSVVSALTAGLVVFVIGSLGTNHIGASSIIFGYFGFLVGMGLYQRNGLSILLAVLVVFFYGGAIFTMFPTAIARAASISWEGHLGGAIGGFLIARSRRLKKLPLPGSAY
ncbi:MAG: rhomboid family intramembrane serine protease [Akkermansiaceae bacterium]|jgi:membrane associated rhomboid family serine protease